jgi:crotonyl-CoA carboxylase/reductase
VLVWGASGGLGVYAIQLCAASGRQRDRRHLDETSATSCWGSAPRASSTARLQVLGPAAQGEHAEYNDWLKEARKFGKAIWDITGKGVNVDIVFEHPGEATFPVSVLVVKRGGMVVICAGTTGFNLTFDARYVWMHQKRMQGSTSPISSRRAPPTS